MTTRHVSAENDYPFQGVLLDYDATAVAGILDLYFIIQGAATRSWTAESSSSSAAPVIPLIHLSSYTVGGSETAFVFAAVSGSNTWEIAFSVPNTGAALGQVYNNDDTSCHAVLIFNSDKITTSGGGSTSIPVEPGRAQWHVEQVDNMSFFNIDRCNGVENEDSSWPVILEEQSSGSGEDLVVDWVDGYNCALAASSSSLELVAGIGAGAGPAPDYGNTGSSCVASDTNILDDAILVINGVPPVNGDIPLTTSPGIVIQRTRGLIELVIR
jgi:hypothetical protein